MKGQDQENAICHDGNKDTSYVVNYCILTMEKKYIERKSSDNYLFQIIFIFMLAIWTLASGNELNSAGTSNQGYWIISTDAL